MDAEQMVPDDPSNWTFQTMESQVQDVSAWGIKKTLAEKTWRLSKIIFWSCTSTR